MITNLNIRGYVNYLYLQRNGSNAPQELLQKWSSLPNDAIQQQLQNLYGSWQLPAAESDAYEKMYVQAIAATVTMAPINTNKTILPPHKVQEHQTQQARPYIAQKKSNNFVLWLFGFVLAGGVLGFIICKTQNGNSQIAANSVTATESDLPSEAPIIEAPIAITDTAINASEIDTTKPILDSTMVQANPKYDADLDRIDKQNQDKIYALFTANEARNFDEIYSFYSPSMEQYWDIQYPTREELQTRFIGLWKKTANPKHNNLTIEKLAPNTYVAKGDFSFDGLVSKTHQTKEFKTIFKFDENGKIIIENNAKQ